MPCRYAMHNATVNSRVAIFRNMHNKQCECETPNGTLPIAFCHTAAAMEGEPQPTETNRFSLLIIRVSLEGFHICSPMFPFSSHYLCLYVTFFYMNRSDTCQLTLIIYKSTKITIYERTK